MLVAFGVILVCVVQVRCKMGFVFVLCCLIEAFVVWGIVVGALVSFAE